jgi:hypothetical protein
MAMGNFGYFGLARLRSGVSLAQANEEINALQDTISAGLAADEKVTLSTVFTPFRLRPHHPQQLHPRRHLARLND